VGFNLLFLVAQNFPIMLHPILSLLQKKKEQGHTTEHTSPTGAALTRYFS